MKSTGCAYKDVTDLVIVEATPEEKGALDQMMKTGDEYSHFDACCDPDMEDAFLAGMELMVRSTGTSTRVGPTLRRYAYDDMIIFKFV